MSESIIFIHFGRAVLPSPEADKEWLPKCNWCDTAENHMNIVLAKNGKHIYLCRKCFGEIEHHVGRLPRG